MMHDMEWDHDHEIVILRENVLTKHQILHRWSIQSQIQDFGHFFQISESSPDSFFLSPQ